MKQIINDFINSIDTKLYSRIRASKGDAECRRYLKEHLSKQCDIHVVSDSFVIEEAKAQIYKCKEVAYGKNTDASNVLEGDYGSWQDWEDVLIKFANKIKQNYY